MMRNLLFVTAGVMAGLLLSLWFSTVVALGPAPGKVGPQDKAENAKGKQEAAAEPQPATKAKNKPPSAKDKAYCEKGANENDCLVQLRTARATEAQARWAKYNTYLVATTIALTLGTVIAGFLTLKTMRETAQKQLRAYVSGRPIHISSFNTTNYAWAKFSIVNSGATPANEVEHWAIVDVFQHPLPEGLQLPTIAPPSSGKFSCVPSLPSEGRVTAARPFTAAEIAEIRTGARRIYVYGEITYRHAFAAGRTRFGCSVTGTPEMLVNLTNNYLNDDLAATFVSLDRWNHAQ